MEETVSYEFGFQQQIAEDISLNTTLYYRDIRNLVATDLIVETYKSGTKYSQYVNRSFGEVKGVTLSLDRRLADNVSAFVDYTYQTAAGDASDPQNQFNASRGDHPRAVEKQLVPLNWDRRHSLNGSVTYAKPSWGGTLLGTYGSGLPYTPQNQGIRTGFENDGRKPEYFNVDLSAFKKFHLNKKYELVLTTTVQNAFDIANENNVFNDTGRAGYSQEEQLAVELPEINTLDEVFTNPSNYSRPRVVRVGLEVAW
jgi:outer membrane receptor for ferrienterochelin and colicin